MREDSGNIGVVASVLRNSLARTAVVTFQLWTIQLELCLAYPMPTLHGLTYTHYHISCTFSHT